ncbi:glycosyltransferase family A protein [Kutzneria sp. NPDC052558]|uniref:glycosyltransferase family A protein n=1 Tax=Kutzneria sp. NPDC052558 TaxID=3364121 RepID=UPI0037CA8948
MPLLSVLTAAHAGRAELLAEAGNSVAAQQLPPGWELEWVVQEDGVAPELERVVKQFPFARHAANLEQLGIAMTRNVALSRIDGSLVHVLDSDDLLLPGALSVAIAAFASHPRVHWVAAQADDLLSDGTRKSFALEWPAGLVEPGAFGLYVEERGELPVHCAGLTLRPGIVRAVGGWAANPRSEDTAMMVAVAELTPGYITPEVTWLHRLHDTQTTGAGSWRSLGDESVLMVRQRLAALRATALF